jgi:proline racemase
VPHVSKQRQGRGGVIALRWEGITKSKKRSPCGVYASQAKKSRAAKGALKSGNKLILMKVNSQLFKLDGAEA